MSLHGQPGDILTYPTNAVVERWIAHETGSLPDFAEDKVNAVARITSGTRPN
jgi:hypothetical protein